MALVVEVGAVTASRIAAFGAPRWHPAWLASIFQKGKAWTDAKGLASSATVSERTAESGSIRGDSTALAITPFRGRPASLRLVTRGPDPVARIDDSRRRKAPLGSRARRERRRRFTTIVIWASATLLLIGFAAFLAASWRR